MDVSRFALSTTAPPAFLIPSLFLTAPGRPLPSWSPSSPSAGSSGTRSVLSSPEDEENSFADEKRVLVVASIFAASASLLRSLPRRHVMLLQRLGHH